MGVHMLKILKIMAVAAVFSLPTLGYGYKYCVDYPRWQCWSCHTSTYYPYAKVCHPINYYYGGDPGRSYYNNPNYNYYQGPTGYGYGYYGGDYYGDGWHGGYYGPGKSSYYGSDNYYYGSGKGMKPSPQMGAPMKSSGPPKNVGSPSNPQSGGGSGGGDGGGHGGKPGH